MVSLPPGGGSDSGARLPPLPRRVFCNRTLNLRSIQVVGCDMDYTLVHYDTRRWESRAYEYARTALVAKRGWPISDLTFDSDLVSLGLVMDLERGNLIKVNRFGYVRAACHGTTMLDFETNRREYGTAPVDLGEASLQVMDTLFSLSEACLFVQLVDLLDAGQLEPGMSYRELYHAVRGALDAAHLEGELKREILADPARYVVLDEQLPQALLNLRAAGKKLLLITNSEWFYTRRLMSYALDPFLGKETWRDLFDIVIVQARKPSFFSGDAPAFRMVDDLDQYTPHMGPLAAEHVYLGGHARLVERSLGVAPDHILYLGDHIFADVVVSKDLLRWRTALIVRELEQELEALTAFRATQRQLDEWMHEKALLEHQLSQVRLRHMTSNGDGGAAGEAAKAAIRAVRTPLLELDQRIAPLAKQSSELGNSRWGPLMRCGNDKSHLARQIERYADVYMSRVSNLLDYTPYAYLRAPRMHLPHELDLGGDA